MTRYWKFIGKQLTELQLPNYCLFFFSLGVQLMILLTQPLSIASVFTFIGTTLGVACVVAINGAKSVNGWLGLLSGICFIIVGFTAKNYLSIAEQLSYMLTLDLPVLINTDWNKDLVHKMRKFTIKSGAIAVIFTIAVAIISGVLIAKLTNDPRPAFDASAFAVSLTGGLVCFLRYNGQYFFWLTSGLLQCALWFVTFREGDASVGMLVNSLIYVTNDVLAFTISPWFNKHVHAQMEAKESARNKNLA